MAKSQPQAADAWISYDGRLSAVHAAALIAANDVTAAERAEAGTLSRTALRHDPTAVSAAATLGVVTLAQNDTATARHLLAYAQMLSRRNVQTQLWSIEDAVRRGDIPGALHWYDIALRTKPELSEMLYPVLAQASRDPTIRAALVRTLAGKPPWADSYVGFAAGQKDDPLSTAALFAGLRARGVAIPPAAQVSVINVLLNGGNVGEAWRYYAAIRPGATRTQARDPDFTALLETPSLFDWMPVNDGNVSASIQRTSDGGAFAFSAPASIGGTVLQQVQLLAAGTYRLSGHSEGIAQDARALPYWTLTCRTDGSELGRVGVPNSAQADGNFTGSLTVPANCPVQTLTLFVQPSDAIGGTSGQIDRVVLAPAR
ncbi:hypothetical protein [uncultured Sphingomonas sp.]|uniref:hypothetical protein n=1 Tax=uncultured Sphingomonas sp. TaxID=158754 RepID=UPI002597B23F|nr:hypothetical protein [uncultured Sphingomonas sp.]